ncbi:MAG: thymidine phosphorylase [Actinomycetota bacterium]
MDLVDVIRTKRDGGRLTDEQISWFLKSYTDGAIPDEQAAALLMAIVWRGMEADELAHWTAAMIASGERLDLSSIGKRTVDKHSTGGVGDKMSLILAPLIATFGLADPMLSGRGLGHTGGTLDKLESISGFRADLSTAEMLKVLSEVGCVICSAGPELAPADRKLYALRDVTGTVESIPLIASSIMSKKIAEGTEALVLDVKVGSGAFMPTLEGARELAETMVQLGAAHGVKTAALLTDMDQPIGRTAGNALEVAESVEVMRGGGPTDTIAITLALADEMLRLTGTEGDSSAPLSDKTALVKWNDMASAQGGDPSAELPAASERKTVAAPRGGFVQRVDARAVGVAAWRLGAGRAAKDQDVSPVAGVETLAAAGTEVQEGEPLFELHADDPALFERALEALDGAVEFGPEPPMERQLVLETIRA